MTTTATKTDTTNMTSRDWVQKIQFENKVDLNLQLPVENESTKIEIDYDISLNSTAFTNNNADSYLQSILSSKPSSSTTACTGSQTCVCYRCQRQRRRAERHAAGPSSDPPNVYTPLGKIEDSSSISNRPTTLLSPPPLSSSEIKNNTTMLVSTTPLVTQQQPQPQQQKKPKRSSTIRKTPTLKSYEKHLPRPAYSQQDSIYRLEKETTEQQQKDKDMILSNNLVQNSVDDSYQISWKEEETGDDLLTSLVTFQTIFEEKGNDSEGLSDLLEQRTKQLKLQSLQDKESEANIQEKEPLPPRLVDCLTLSYRDGAKHNPLTLYHTMKMQNEKQRMDAYNVAFQHCIRANSGMRDWIKKPRVAPTREGSKLVQSARRPTVKRSLLHPLSSKRNRVAGDELLIFSASSDNLGISANHNNMSVRSNISKKSIEMISSPIPLVHTPQTQQQQEEDTNDQITDILAKAHNLLPSNTQQFSTNATSPLTQQRKVPYDHIDAPGRFRQLSSTNTSISLTDTKDSSSISSSESSNGTSKLTKGRSSRLFSSLGRKASLRSSSSSGSGSPRKQKASSVRSLEKVESEEKVLDDLCQVLPHLQRSKLLPFVEEAEYDYMKSLQLCKSAVIAGKLS